MSGLLNIACVNTDVLQRILNEQRIACRKVHSPVVLTYYHLIHAQYGIDGSSDLMGHVRKEVTLSIISALGSYLLLKELALSLDIRSYCKKRQNSTDQERYNEDYHISYYGRSGLCRQLVFKPAYGKVDRYNTGDIALRVKYRAVRTVELSPLIRIRGLVHGSSSLRST